MENNAEPLRILLIEDDPDDVFLINDMISGMASKRIALEHVGRLDAGIERVNNGGIDLVLLDLGLPDSNGLETVKGLLAEKTDVPVVVLTGNSDEQAGFAAVQAGAQDYLIKGEISPTLLTRYIKFAVERFRLERESQARMLKIIGESADGILLVDAEDKVIFANPAAGQMFGQQVARLVGRPCGFCTPGHGLTEIEIAGQDGQLTVAEIRLSHIELDGRPVRLVTLRDITERKRAVEDLRISEEKFRAIASSALDAVILKNNKGETVYWNPAAERIFGYSATEVLGRNLHDLIMPQIYSERYLKGIEQFLKTGTGPAISRVVELMALHKDGHEFPVEIAVSAIEIKGEYWATAIVRDITERKRAEQEKLALESQLRHQQKLEAIGTLASGVAHEINNPISAILNFAELIGETSSTDDRCKDYAARIVNETQRVAEIVRNLLTFARQEKEQHSPARVEDLIGTTLSLIRAVLRKDQIAFEVDIAEGLPKIKCRSQQIQQVLMNLFTNARDAVNARFPAESDRKLIKISARPDRLEDVAAVRITVEDNGQGIEQKNLLRMFDPFFTTKPRGQGTGLGLSISHGIVRDHHGRIIAESEVGRFTRMHLLLPADNGWSVKSDTFEE